MVNKFNNYLFLEREQECRLLERRLKIVEENNLALFKHAEELKVSGIVFLGKKLQNMMLYVETDNEM